MTDALLVCVISILRFVCDYALSYCGVAYFFLCAVNHLGLYTIILPYCCSVVLRITVYVQ
jgi:hypothetical protein